MNLQSIVVILIYQRRNKTPSGVGFLQSPGQWVCRDQDLSCLHSRPFWFPPCTQRPDLGLERARPNGCEDSRWVLRRTVGSTSPLPWTSFYRCCNIQVFSRSLGGQESAAGFTKIKVGQGWFLLGPEGQSISLPFSASGGHPGLWPLPPSSQHISQPLFLPSHVSSPSEPLPVIRTHPDNPGASTCLKIPNLLTSAKSLLQCKMASGSRA